MDKRKELPIRADNHIRETSGYKVLESVIPSQWMIRDVTERDYGIDCYIELVDEDNRLTGEIAFVQMKSTDKIDWRVRDNGFRFYKVERTTTNYLSGFRIPTYLFLVDLTAKELYFLPVKEYKLEHYKEYSSKTDSFFYEFYKDRDLFSVASFQKSFRKSNQYEQFRNELQYFMSNLHNYIDFCWEHNNRDCFMQIEVEGMMFFESMHRNLSFLQEYFEIPTALPSIETLANMGVKKYGDDYEHTLFEGVLTDLFDDLKASILEVADRMIELVTEKEGFYWLVERNYIFNYFNYLDKSKLFS